MTKINIESLEQCNLTKKPKHKLASSDVSKRDVLIKVAKDWPWETVERTDRMSKQSLAHENLEWTKQKLDELDAMLASLEGAVAALKGDARKEADCAIIQIQAARNAFKGKVDAARADAAAMKDITDDAVVRLQTRWVEVELAFQAFLAAAAGQADIVKHVLAARAGVQRKEWQASLDGVGAAASEAINQARDEVNAAIRRLAIETKLDQVSTAGHESWKAIKDAFEETVAVYDRTSKKITDALAKVH